MSRILRLTPVLNSATGKVVRVELPEGYSRVWSGRIEVGDLYLHWQKFWLHGVTEWVRLSAEKIIEDGHYYDSPAWFGCLIRERSEDKGKPCAKCGVTSPFPPLDCCDTCLAKAMF